MNPDCPGCTTAKKGGIGINVPYTSFYIGFKL